MRILVCRGAAEATRVVAATLRMVHDVEECERLEEAVQRLRLEPADLLIVVSPAAGRGAATIRRRLEPLRGGAVLVVVDALALDERLAVLHAGADYLAAPFRSEELLVRVTRVRPPFAAPKHTLSVADLTIDEAGMEVRRGSKRVDLTPREFELLAHLAHRRGVVLSKEELLRRVWGPGTFNRNVLEVAISALRRKLEADGDRLIHTVHGVGYVLRDSARVRPARADRADAPEDHLARQAELRARRQALLERTRRLLADTDAVVASPRSKDDDGR